MPRLIIRKRKPGDVTAEEKAAVAAVSSVLDSSPRMLVVDAQATDFGEFLATHPGWSVLPQLEYTLPTDPRPVPKPGG